MHGEAEGNREKAAEHDPVAEADEVDVEMRGVDAKIKFGAAVLEVEGPKPQLFSPSSACSTS